MKVLAIYTQRTLPLVRRVLAPYGALTERGHQFSSLAVSDFTHGLALSFDHDVTVLPNWVLSQEAIEELSAVVATSGKHFAYDLSDPDLLKDERVRATLSLMSLVTVPNEYVSREVRLLGIRAPVAVTPSTLDVPYFMSGRSYHLTDTRTHVGGPIVGCFGNHDWAIVKPALEHFKKQERMLLTVFGDSFARSVLGDLVTPVEVTLETYPALLNACTFGLCPYDGNKGQETAWAYEYGILYKPVIASIESPYARELGGVRHKGELRAVEFASNTLPERWTDAIRLWITRPELRARAGREAFELANSRRAARACETYLKAMRYILPQLAPVV